MSQSADRCPVDHHSERSLDSLPTPPGTNGLPLVGDTLEFLFRPEHFAEKRRAKFGDIYYANILGARTVNISGPAGHQWVFTGENKYLKNRWFSSIRMLLGNNSLPVIEGDAHRARRQMYAPQFSHSAMSEFVPVINQIVARYLSKWAGQAEAVDIASAMRELTFEIVTAFVFGDTECIDRHRLGETLEIWMKGMFGLPVNLPFTGFGKAIRARQALCDMLNAVIQQRRQSGDMGKGVLSTLLLARDSQGQPLSDETVTDEILAMLLAGHETTIITSSYMVIFLAQHPELVAKLRAEHAALSADALEDMNQLKNLPYTDCVINETIRYIHPIGGLFRVMTEDTEYQGFRIPAGYAVMITPMTTHHDPAIWTNPEKFEPERFERGEHKQQPFSFIPFGGGPRLCLGHNFAMTELRIILGQLVRSYDWSLLTSQEIVPPVFPLPPLKKGRMIKIQRQAL